MLFKTPRATDRTVELSYEIRYPNPPPLFEHNKVSQINPIRIYSSLENLPPCHVSYFPTYTGIR